jgi:hypothetical protein
LLRGESLEESDALPEPDVLAQEIGDDMQTDEKHLLALLYYCFAIGSEPSLDE